MGGSGGSGPSAASPTTPAVTVAGATGRHPDGYQRSLIYSGLLGLTIATIGLSMVGRRRRLW
jgi:hypothetical protein